jgi:hypothetical protein
MRTRAALLLVATTVFFSSAVQAAVVEKTKFRGTDVATVFTVTGDISCPNGTPGQVLGSGFILGSSLVVKTTGEGKTSLNGVFVELDSYSNSCTETSLDFATDSFPDGLNPPNKNLKKAALEGSTVLVDPVTGVEVSVALDIKVAGTGPVISQSDSTRTRVVPPPAGPITITITKSTDNGRDGVATGTMTFEGVTVTPTFSGATLSFDKNVDVTIER